MGNRTPLYQQHLDAGAKIVDFGGWEMPIQYQSVIEEHHAVRQHAGVFDVSHMTVVDISGPDSKAYLQYLLANDVAKLTDDGMALYSAMLNEAGGIIDDLIVYRMPWGFRVVSNCATRRKDLAWMSEQARDFTVSLSEKPDLAILAVNGPQSIDIVCSLLDAQQAEQIRALGNFRGAAMGDCFVARTGYTGERGLEIILPGEQAPELWDRLLGAGVKPIGLGARDTLRLEAGMNLYGHDMDESITPFSANMEQTIAWEPAGRNFIGRAALEPLRQQQGQLPRLVGLVLEERGVLREGMKVVCSLDEGQEEGSITSGSFSPTLKHSIALARIPANTHNCQVEMRGRLLHVRIVKPGFVRFGKKIFE